MDALNLLVLALATWRLAYMLVYEKGPRKMFVYLRNISRRWGWTVLECDRCVSIWAGAWLLCALHTWAWPIVWVLAASGLAIMLGSFTGATFDVQE